MKSWLNRKSRNGVVLLFMSLYFIFKKINILKNTSLITLKFKYMKIYAPFLSHYVFLEKHA